MSTNYKNNFNKKSIIRPRIGWWCSLPPLLFVVQTLFTCCCAQSNAGVYDFGLARAGERRGSWTPGEWLAATLLLMTIGLGLAVSLGLCYYVRKGRTRTSFATGAEPQSSPSHLDGPSSQMMNVTNNNNDHLLVARI